MIATLVSAVMATILGAVLVLVVAAIRTDRETMGMRYYGLNASGRRALKERISRRGARVRPLFNLLAKLPSQLPSFVHHDVHGPSGTCDARSFAAAEVYVPQPGDIFIATQMKCGTTWMQQLVYEMLMDGKGNFDDGGHGHLYATSPWLEARVGVSVEAAPRLGERRVRLIKTHLPVSICPYSPEAKYIYVARNPISCFASTVDFLAMLAGPMCPPREWLLDWYLSDRMWWRPWPDHFLGWYRRSTECRNVLFVHYEDMLSDLPEVLSKVSGFLDLSISSASQAAVIRKSRIEYMREHEERFEMSPPTLFSAGKAGAYFSHGSASRQRMATVAERVAIINYCRSKLAEGGIRVEDFYSVDG